MNDFLRTEGNNPNFVSHPLYEDREHDNAEIPQQLELLETDTPETYMKRVIDFYELGEDDPRTRLLTSLHELIKAGSLSTVANSKYSSFKDNELPSEVARLFPKRDNNFVISVDYAATIINEINLLQHALNNVLEERLQERLQTQAKHSSIYDAILRFFTNRYISTASPTDFYDSYDLEREIGMVRGYLNRIQDHLHIEKIDEYDHSKMHFGAAVLVLISILTKLGVYQDRSHGVKMSIQLKKIYLQG